MEIESGVDVPKKKSRARTKKKDKQNPAESLLRALKFIMPTQDKHSFCFISNNWLVGQNDLFVMGIKIEEDLQCCPHTKSF